MSEKEALQSAADEARKAARAAREFARFLDDYAKHLTQPNWRQRADDFHVSALNKLAVINESLAVSHKWVEESLKSPVASREHTALKQTAPNETVGSKVRKKKVVTEKPKPRSIQIRKRSSDK